jgi:arsenate reductase (glutaredoxin)
MLKIYTYQGCSTCRKAVQWLRAHEIAYDEYPIRETPPKFSELQAMLAAYEGNLQKLCNTSGQDYRALGLSTKLPTMSLEQGLTVLAGNGRIVKRPFAIDEARGIHLVGFKEAEWKQAFLA